MSQVPVLVGNCDGFVGNRMYAFMGTEAQFCVEEGALPQEVDAVLEDYGFPLGIFKVGDLSGTSPTKTDVFFALQSNATSTMFILVKYDENEKMTSLSY